MGCCCVGAEGYCGEFVFAGWEDSDFLEGERGQWAMEGGGRRGDCTCYCAHLGESYGLRGIDRGFDLLALLVVFREMGRWL